MSPPTHRARDPRQRPRCRRRGSGSSSASRYSDGFGREIQKKIQAEPGPLVEGGPASTRAGSAAAGPSSTTRASRSASTSRSSAPRTASSSACTVGVSPVLFYDPVERVVATLHPNHTYEKVVFDPWQQTTYDVNDTCAPRNAADRRPAHRPRHRRLRGARTSQLPQPAAHLADLARAAHRRRARPGRAGRRPRAPQPMPTRRPPRTSTRSAAPS